MPDPEVLLDKHQLQKLSRFLLDPWVYRASMASLASRGTLGFKALWASKAPKVYWASLAKMVSTGSPARLGLSVILVSLDCKALQDLKELQGRRVPSGGLERPGRA